MCLSGRVLARFHGCQSAKVAVTAPIRETGKKKTQREEEGEKEEEESRLEDRAAANTTSGTWLQQEDIFRGGTCQRYVSETNCVKVADAQSFLAEISADCCLYET